MYFVVCYPYMTNGCAMLWSYFGKKGLEQGYTMLLRLSNTILMELNYKVPLI